VPADALDRRDRLDRDDRRAGLGHEAGELASAGAQVDGCLAGSRREINTEPIERQRESQAFHGHTCRRRG